MFRTIHQNSGIQELGFQRTLQAASHIIANNVISKFLLIPLGTNTLRALLK